MVEPEHPRGALLPLRADEVGVNGGVFAMGAQERARTVLFARRLFALRHQLVVGGLLLALLSATAIGWRALIPACGLVAFVSALVSVVPHVDRPERPLLLAFVAAEALLVAVIAMATQIQLDLLCLLLLPATAACIIFPTRVMVGTTIVAALAMVGTALLVDRARLLDDPPVLLIPLGVMVTVALPAAMVRRLEVRALSSATTDALTGALNRSALETRIVALSGQSHELPLRVGAVMIDLDHFKQINDRRGHDVGDRVLKEVVHRIRAAVGPLTPIYRVGGEEFLVLLAGAVESETQRVGDQLRRVIAAAPIEHEPVTMSGGVAAGTLDHYDIRTVIRAADEALYEAKRSGRDRVVVGNLAQMYVLGGELAPGDRASGASAGADHERREILPLRAPQRRRSAVEEPSPSGFTGPKANWLVRGEFERDHMRELASALNTTHHLALGAVFLALVASIPWMGWEPLMPAVVAVPIYHVAQRRVTRLRRPEYVLGAAWLGVQVAICLGAVIAADPQPYMLTLFAPMLVGMAAVFPSRGAALNVVLTLLLAVAAGYLALPELVRSEPGLFAPFAGVISAIAVMSSVAGRSSIELRTRAVVDPLTGMLSRGALRARLLELEQEDHVGAGSVAVIAFDLDHFKAINDDRGHAAGDAALAAVGAAVRSELHALAWAFRLGGDEFVVVLPGSVDVAAALAERIRVAIGRQPALPGMLVSASFGVAASREGEWFDFDAVARRADTALYEAKRAGRDRVAVAASDAKGPVLVAKTVSGG